MRARLYKSDLVELAQGAPAEALRPYVRRYTAWLDRGTRTIRRRHLPSGDLPLIINFGARVRLGHDGSGWTDEQSFGAGLHDTLTLSESAGPNLGVQVDFTAPGARLFYDRPLLDLANRSVALDDLLGPEADALASMLFEAPTWDARFDVLDREILSRVAGAAPLKREIAWACERLTRTAGNVPIARLAGDIGWSSRHLATQFRTEFGLRPKTYGRVMRFNHAVRLMSRGDTALLADVAARAGYFDQAHFVREVHEFAGVPPRTLREGRSEFS